MPEIRSDLKERAEVMEEMADALQSSIFAMDSVIYLSTAVSGTAKAEIIKYCSKARAALTMYNIYKKKWERT